MFKNLKIWQKLSLIVIAFSVPVGVLLHFLVSEQNISLDFARNELDGTQYLRPVRKLLGDVYDHRNLAALVLSSGEAAHRDRLQAKEAEVAADLSAVEAVDQRFANKLKIGKQLASIKSFWDDLQKHTLLSTAEVSFEQHRKLTSMVFNMIIILGNDSYLILDPDVDSYYAMDATIFKIPQLTNDLSQLESVATSAIATRVGEISPGKRAQLASLHAVAEEALGALEGNLSYALAYNPDLDARLKPLIGYVDNATRDLLDAVDKLVTSPAAGVQLRDIDALANKATESSFTLYDSTLPILDGLLAARIEGNSRRRAFSFMGVAFALALSILLTVLIVRSITGPVRHLSEAAERISMGEMGVELAIHGGDGIGQLSERFRRMQESLKVAMQQLEV